MRLLEVRSSFRQTTLGRAFSILSRDDRRKVFAVVIIQILLGLLDLAGVAIFGVLGALAVTGVGSRAPGNRVSTFLETIGLSNFNLQ